MLGFLGGAYIYCFSFFLYIREDPLVRSTNIDVGYLVWSLFASSFVGFISGTCSFAGSYYFVKKIYKKVELQKER